MDRFSSLLLQPVYCDITTCSLWKIPLCANRRTSENSKCHFSTIIKIVLTLRIPWKGLRDPSDHTLRTAGINYIIPKSGRWWILCAFWAQAKVSITKVSISAAKVLLWCQNESESVSCSVLSKSLWPQGLWPARSLCPGHPPGKNTGVGSHSLLQGIFLTQGSNSRLLHWQVDTLPSESLGKPMMSKVIKYYHFPQIHTLSQCCWNDWDNTKCKAPQPNTWYLVRACVVTIT